MTGGGCQSPHKSVTLKVKGVAMPLLFPPMRLTLYVVVFLLALQSANSQSSAAQAAGTNEPGNLRGATPPATGLSGSRSSAVTKPGISPAPVGTITDTGFASRLGTTVSSQGYPTVALPPGVSNINHPGMQPTPSIQPLPTGFPVPNINYPGGMPGMNSPIPSDRRDHRPGHGERGTSGVIYYGIPYYVPYLVYPQETSSASATAASGSAYGAPSAQSAAKPVTLLAFKDHTVLIVIDYWLEGDWLYYETSPGMRLSAPLDRLDLPLTQQLNRERNVPFVLQSRP